MSVLHHQRVVDSPIGETRSTTYAHRFSPGQILGGLAGAFLTVVGIIAVTRTGIDGHLNTPVTNILGVTHSAFVGLGEMAVGLLLVVTASSVMFRGAMGFLGALLMIAGVILAAGSAKILLDVGATHTTGWFGIILGGVAILAAMLPTYFRSDTAVERGPGY